MVTLPRFNLLDEPWLPAIMGDGERKRLGLLDAFRQADAVRALEHPSPLATAALHRLLLAVLHRALAPGTAEEEAGWFERGWPLERITGYLEAWRERFFLFHRTQPFWQTAGCDVREAKPWAVLAAEHNASNGEGSKILFDYPCQWRGVGARPGDMACWLAAAQTFALPGGRGYSPAPSSSALLAFSVGGCLRETLLLNLPPQDAAAQAADLPVWEAGPETARSLRGRPRRLPAGYADLYTWPSRAVHLHPEEDGSVLRAGFKPGLGLERTGGAPAFRDPMAAHGADGVPAGPGRRGLWRDFDSLFPRPPRGGRAPLVVDHAEALCRLLARRPAGLPVMVCGQAGDKAKIEFWRMECFVLPGGPAGPGAAAERLLGLAQTWQGWLYNACATFVRERAGRGGAARPDAAEVRRAVERMPCMAVYWNHLEQCFKRGLEGGFAGAPEEAEARWRGEIREAVILAWKAQTEAAGGGAWTIRAMVKAGGTIGKALKELGRFTT